MTTHLSDEQRQALTAGRPVEVVDSDTQLGVIVLAAERYRQRIQEVTAGEGGQPQPVPPQTVRPFPPVPCRLRDLPTPPEIAEFAKKCCTAWLFGRKKALQWIEEELKLQYYFGGISVGYLKTAAGRVVFAAGRMESEEFGKQLDAVPLEQRQQVIFFVPPLRGDEISELWTPFAYED